MIERARQSRRWRDMENMHIAQHYSKERFKVPFSFVMPCSAPNLSSQVEE